MIYWQQTEKETAKQMLMELKTRHREIARLAFEGYKPAEIATKMDVSYGTVTKILKDPMCKAYVAQLEDQANADLIAQRKKLLGINSKAIDALEDCLDADEASHATKISAAKLVLDYNGFAPVQKHQHAHAVLTSDDILEIKERAVQAGIANGMIVMDAEYEQQT